MRAVVRNLAAERTHVADVDERYVRDAVMFGAPYRRPDSATRAACGVSISDGVLMRTGTKVQCSACRHITGMTEAT